MVRNWPEYYQLGKSRPVREHLLRTLRFLERPTMGLHALDLGCGQGIEVFYLLERGFSVEAWDADESGLQLLRDRTQAGLPLSITQCRFEDVTAFPQVDLLWSYHSLPFCQGEELPRLVSLLPSAIKPKGFLGLTVFGPQDEWVKQGTASGISESELREALRPLSIVSFRELLKTGPTLKGDMKFWHVFEVVAWAG